MKTEPRCTCPTRHVTSAEDRDEQRRALWKAWEKDDFIGVAAANYKLALCPIIANELSNRALASIPMTQAEGELFEPLTDQGGA